MPTMAARLVAPGMLWWWSWQGSSNPHIDVMVKRVIHG
jgi:hypothetical protein